MKLDLDHLLFAAISGGIALVMLAHGDAFARLGTFFAS